MAPNDRIRVVDAPKGWAGKNLNLLWLSLPIGVSLYVLFSLCSYALHRSSGGIAFRLLGRLRIPGFTDTKWLLSMSACKGSIRDLVMANTKCFGYTDPGHPALSMELGRWLGLGPNDAHWIGLVSGASISVVLAHACWLYAKSIGSWSIIVSLLALSFPYQLAIERGNLDGVIFLLLALFCLLVWRTGFPSLIAANATAAFATALKIYPVIAIIAWLIILPQTPLPRSHKRALSLSLPFTAAASLHFALKSLYTEVQAASGSLLSHGLGAMHYAYAFLTSELGLALGKELNSAQLPLKIIAIGLGLSGGLCFGRQLNPAIRGDENRGDEKASSTLLNRYGITLAMVASAVSIGCYIVSMSYDYRFIFLLPILALILSNLINPSTLSTSGRLFLGALAAAGAYVFTLPYALDLGPRLLTYLELVDEMLLAPYVLSGLTGVWIQLHSRLFLTLGGRRTTVAVAT